MEKELAQEIIDIFRQNNVKSLSLNKFLAEVEIAIIKELKHDHVTKADLSVALKINRTTLCEKMKRYRIAM